MQVITSWTGAHADALRKSLRMTNESFAEHLGVGVRTVANWRKDPTITPKAKVQEILDTALERAPDRAKAQFVALMSEVSSQAGGTEAGDAVPATPESVATGVAHEDVPLLTDNRLPFGRGPLSQAQPVREPASSLVEHDVGDPANGSGWFHDLARSVSILDGLAVADLADGPVAGSRWASAAVPGLITGFLFSGQEWQDGLGAGGLAVPAPGNGVAAAGRIRTFTHSLMDLDFQYGGGHVRRVLLFYFRSEIVPLLRVQHPERVRRELFSAAAEVAELLGWSAYDAGRHGVAQRYFAQGLRLATEAADPVHGARLMSSLSHQANYLGQFGEALQLARAAQSAAAGQATATVRSMFLAMEARALASLGDPSRCAAVLHRAERELDRRAPANDPEWIYYFDELELTGEAAHCARDLGQARQAREFAARALDPAATPPRTAAFISLVDAAGALQGGDLEEALALASGAVELAGPLQSARYLRYVSDFHSALVSREQATDLSVRQFTGLVTAAYPGLPLEGAPVAPGDLAAQRSYPALNLLGDVA